MTTSEAIRRGLAFEAGIWSSLGRWIARRPAVPTGAEVFTYHRMTAPVFWLFIIGSGVEVVAVDVILPWFTARVIAAVLGIWGLVWMVGMLGALKMHPHLVAGEGLRVRNGFAVDLLVPWSAIASVSGQSRDLESSMRSVQLEEAASGDVLCVGVSGRTNVLLRLHEPAAFATSSGEHVVTGVRLWADDQRGLITRVKAGTTQERPRA